MDDFAQTMNNWKRMCNEMTKEYEDTACEKCGLKDFGCPAIYERECEGANWDRVKKVVTAWAAEHKEPVYPTWAKWLVEIGAAIRVPIGEPYPVEMADGSMPGPFYETVVEDKKRIPANIAQMLGIEPIAE